METNTLTTKEIIASRKSFESLSLIPPLLQAVHFAGYKTPSPIQAALIPVACQGHDVIGQAQTGTGKTAAFLLPFMNSWRGGDPKFPQGLVMTPTRELALQVAEEAIKLSPSKFFHVVAAYGGQKIEKQLRQLQKGCSLLVGTPGRIMDLLRRHSLRFDAVRYVVLDEADRMFDIGFRPQIERILNRVPDEKQTLLLSATISPEILELTKQYLNKPKLVRIISKALTVDRIKQTYFTVDDDKKTQLLLQIFEKEQPRQAIIFVERKRTADFLHHQTKDLLPRSAVTHGDMPQVKRERIMAAFRKGVVKTLIATDVMSRGIDVQGISHIINYDLPQDVENYVHRIGRTGRMGADGVAISFVTPEQGRLLTSIETTINHMIPECRLENFKAFTPKDRSENLEGEGNKETTSVFGRPTRKYTNRL